MKNNNPQFLPVSKGTVKTIVVLSGGLDSTTLLHFLLQASEKIAAISFDYGQKHKKELEGARATCIELGVPHLIIDVSGLNAILSNSSLTTKEKEVPKGHYADESMKATVVPNRNMIMASIAIGYAVNVGAQKIALGVHSGDKLVKFFSLWKKPLYKK